MGKKSNAKGKSGERELARKLRELSDLFSDARRNFGQSRKRGEVPDLEVHDALWPECKRMRRCSPAAALRQAIEECRIADSDRTPIAFCRDDDGEWTVTLRLTDWAPMFEAKHDLDSVCVTAATAAELDAADKRLREAAEGLEPRGPGGTEAALVNLREALDDEDRAAMDEWLTGGLEKTGTGE